MSDQAINDSPPASPAEMLLPAKSTLALIWAFFVCVVLALLLTLSVIVAIRNLLHPHDSAWLALAASIVWIALVAVLLWNFCQAMGGVRQWLINILGTFASRQFVRIEEQAGAGERQLALGFRFLGMTLYYRKVALSGITGVNWHAGQTSHRAKRDLPDWSVAIWYDPKVVRLGQTPDHRYAANALDIVGHEGPRAAIEQLGLEIVEFLRRAGAVPLVAGQDDEQRRMQFVVAAGNHSSRPLIPRK